MITLDADLTLLKNRLNISGTRLVEYTDKSVDEIIEAEAAQGNTQAVSAGNEMFTDTATLIKVFQLETPENKFRILSQMKEDDLSELLPLLEDDDLRIALNYFNQDKLIQMLEKLPKAQLVSVAMELFSEEEILKMMPERQIDKLLTSNELDKGLVMKYMREMPPEILAGMLENVTGKPVQSMEQSDLLEQFAQLNPEKYKDALTSMDPEIKRMFIGAMAQEEPKLYEMFDSDAYTNLINLKQKPEITKATNGIETEQLLKMIDQLPKELMAVVLTQINTEDFAEILINQYPEMLQKLAAG